MSRAKSVEVRTWNCDSGDETIRYLAARASSGNYGMNLRLGRESSWSKVPLQVDLFLEWLYQTKLGSHSFSSHRLPSILLQCSVWYNSTVSAEGASYLQSPSHSTTKYRESTFGAYRQNLSNYPSGNHIFCRVNEL